MKHELCKQHLSDIETFHCHYWCEKKKSKSLLSCVTCKLLLNGKSIKWIKCKGVICVTEWSLEYESQQRCDRKKKWPIENNYRALVCFDVLGLALRSYEKQITMLPEEFNNFFMSDAMDRKMNTVKKCYLLHIVWDRPEQLTKIHTNIWPAGHTGQENDCTFVWSTKEASSKIEITEVSVSQVQDQMEWNWIRIKLRW